MKIRKALAATAAAVAATLAVVGGVPAPGSGLVTATQPSGCC